MLSEHFCTIMLDGNSFCSQAEGTLVLVG